MTVYSGKKNPELLDYLLKRRSAPKDGLDAPGPDKTQLEQILRAGTRVPDHGKMCPWYFLVFEGKAREEAGKLAAEAFVKANPDARPDKVEIEAARFMRAPLVIAVISRMRRGKNPFWEQMLSAGAVCMNLSLAAHALGFGAQWLTEWMAYNAGFKSALGLDAGDHIAGFIYIGSVTKQPEERDRPDLSAVVTHWLPCAELNKGDQYHNEKFGYPEKGFDFSDL